MYKGVSGDVTIVDAGAGRKLTISSTAGWSDTVVWSPYGDEGMGCTRSARAASRVLGPAHIASSAYGARVLTRGTHPCCRYNGFVCVENAQALEPVEVAAGATWTGEMSVAPSPL